MMKKLAKAFLWLLITMLGLITITYFVVLIVNWNDASPSETALRFKNNFNNRPFIADEDNAYVYVMGFTVNKDEDPREWGAKRISWAQEIINKPQVGQYLGDSPGKDIDFDFSEIPESAFGVFENPCKSSDQECLTKYENSESAISEILHSEAWLLNRYKTLLAHPGWLETQPFDVRLPFPSFSSILAGQKLFHAQAWLRAGKGDVNGVKTMLQNEGLFWRKILAASDTLISKMIAKAALNKHFLSSYIILRRLPPEMMVQGVPPELHTPFSESEKSMARCLTGEWVFFDNSVKQFKRGGLGSVAALYYFEEDSPFNSIFGAIFKPLLQPQDTSNIFAEHVDKIIMNLDVPYDHYIDAVGRIRKLESAPEESSVFPRRIYNIVGDKLYSFAAPSFISFATTVSNLEGVRRMAKLAVELRSQEVETNNIAQYLTRAETKNPYTGNPFEWDKEEESLVFVGLRSEKFQRYKLVY